MWLMIAGAAVFCAGVVCAQIHQVTKGPHRAYWITYLALAISLAGGVLFVAGAMLLGQ